MCSFIRKTQKKKKKKKKKVPTARFFSRLPSLGFFVFVNLLFSPNSNPEYISGNKINKSNKKPERIFFILCIKNVFFNQNYFLSNFYFSPHNSPSKTMKNVLYFI